MFRTVIEEINVHYLGEVIKIQDVKTRSERGLRYFIKGFGLNGRYGKKCFETLWRMFRFHKQLQRLNAIKTRLRIRDWIINALPNRLIADNAIELVSWDRKYRIV